MNVTIVGPNLPSAAKATFEVHATGCAHVTVNPRQPYAFNRRGWGMCDGFTMDADSRLDVESCVYDFAPAESEGYVLGDYQSDFHFAPCCKLPLDAPAPLFEAVALITVDEDGTIV